MKRYIKDGVVKTRTNIVIKKDGMQIINPAEDMVLADGWVEYIPAPVEATPYVKSPLAVIEELVTKQWNERTDISNEEALDYMVIVYPWSNFIGKELPVGKIVEHEGKLWRVRQAHTSQETYVPSMATASLFEVIEKEHSGVADDPIPYAPPMEIFAGKYYTEDGATFLCTRDSGTALAHNLKDLIGIYVVAV